MLKADGAIVVKTDISSFYERVYHHRLQNCIEDFFPKNVSKISVQVDRILNQLAAGRSFGLPVGGQGARILAELLVSSIDQRLSDSRIVAHRYVDDFTLITTSQAKAYDALSELSHALADYGLSLNRTKTTILTAKHYLDYVGVQLGTPDDDAQRLKQIDLHFDPYSDTADSDFEELRETISQLEVQRLLHLELQKSQPDAFLVTQIGRTLKLHPPKVALQLCATLLDSKNLNSFRASWATIMRGIAAVRKEDSNSSIFEALDQLIDDIPDHSHHLLVPEANQLFYLKLLRFKKTQKRGQFVSTTFSSSHSQTVRRACIECWHEWKDRPNFNKMSNMWNTMGAEEQRMLWYAAPAFGDEGMFFRKRVENSLQTQWQLGIERRKSHKFFSLYSEWARDGV